MKLYSFSKGLKRARKAAGFTQESFANEFNVSLKTIQNWEQNACTPNSKDLIALCKFFNCDMDYLFHNIDCKTHDLEFIHEQTGLTEDAIKSLIGLNNLNEMFPDCQNDKFDLINLILQDTHKKESFSSLLDLIVGFCRFTIPAASDSLYTVDSNGITKFQGHPSLSGKGMSYNPLQAHFHMQDMESMYYLKIWDAIRELKEMYTVYQNPEKN